MKENYIWIIFVTKLDMIDKILYKFFGFVDDMFMKVETVLTFHFPKEKNKSTKKKPSNEDLFNGEWIN